jgi:hypothetical protein
MIYRIAGSQNMVLFTSLAILFGTSGIMVEQFKFLAEHHHLNFIPGEVALEENIVILIACFGVFLEHRRYLLNKIYETNIPGFIEQFDQYSHNMGVMFIMIAILIEALDLCFLALNKYRIDFPGLKYFEILLLFVINIMASILLFIVGLKSIQR